MRRIFSTPYAARLITTVCALSPLGCQNPSPPDRIQDPTVFEIPETLTIEQFFQKTTTGNMTAMVDTFYDPSIRFEDPIGTIQGTKKLKAYYNHMYENLIDINFRFDEVIHQKDTAFAIWHMTLRHRSVNDGEPIEVPGSSFFRFRNGKAIYHRDYFDAGAMIYEHIPMIGYFIRKIKAEAGDHP